MLRTVCLATILLSPSAFAQSDWFVDGAGVPPGTGTVQDPYTSIQFALSRPSTIDGDQLLVASGTYAESIDFLGKSVTVQHDGAGAVPVIEGDGIRSAVSFVSGEGPAAVLRHFEVTGSVPAFPVSQPGGAVLIDGAHPLLESIVVRDSSAGRGGGVAVLSGGLTLSGCVVRDNTAQTGGGGGIHIASGTLVVSGGAVQDNVAAGGNDGGGIEALAGTSLDLRDLVVQRNNVFFGSGGGIYARGDATLDHVEILSNACCSFPSECWAGGGIYSPGAVGTNCTIEDNGTLVTREGGGAYGGSWTDTVFRINTAGSGGGLHSGFAERCEFLYNSTDTEGDVPSGPGGGATESTLHDCLLLGNISQGGGGGAANSSLIRCRVANNRSVLFGFSGGGVLGGTAVDCLIEGNHTTGLLDGAGGGAANADLTRCIVRGNSARVGGGAWGGSMHRCTVVHNLASGDSGQFGAGCANVAVTNSVVWGNAPDQILGGTTTYTNVQGGEPGVGNIDAAPGFFGPGSDVHLLGNSPCIDAGDPASAPDPDGSVADMGAIPFEMFHRREDSTFCAGSEGLEIEGALSLSGPPARLLNPGATLFLVGGDSGYFPRVFPGPNIQEPTALCLLGGVTRLLPTAQGELELSPALLGQLGLGPGDRLLVQSYGLVLGNVRISRGVDLLVLP